MCNSDGRRTYIQKASDCYAKTDVHGREILESDTGSDSDGCDDDDGADDDDDDGDGDDDDDDGSCFRCGRQSHWATHCYAKTDVDGNAISD